MTKFTRKKKLINSRLQLKLIGVFLGVSCVASMFQVVLLNRAMLELSGQLPADGDRLLGHLPEILTTNVLLTFGVLAPLTFLIGLLVTNRVAGPAFNMTRHCRRIANGEDPGPCRIRKDDELHELCNALNAALTRLRADGTAPPPAVEGQQEPESLVRDETDEPASSDA